MPSYTNPQNLNRYSYVSNNPLRYTDPTGHAAVGDTDEAGCSGSGPACIIDMYTSYSDEDGMMDSLRHHVRRHKDYNPVLDPSLSDEERAIVSIAMFQVAVQDTPGDTSLWDIIKATWPSAASLSIFGIIIDGINMSPDGGGGGWSNRSNIIQFGDHTIDESVLKHFGTTRDQFHNALRKLKDENGLGNNFHGNIAANGDYINPATGTAIDNIKGYLP